MRFDMLVTSATILKGRRLIAAACDGAKRYGHDARIVTSAWHVRPDAVLMLYGLGGADRLPVAQQHMARLGKLVAFDLGYWHRKEPVRHFRVSINGFHCPQLVMRHPLRANPERWEQSGLTLQKAGGDPDGPVLLVGNSPKSNAVGATGWTQAKAQEIRRALPGKAIVYRPKPQRPPERGVDFDEIAIDGPIEELLQRASLVVCRHSNVSVDACRLGVPVVCDDGAAAAIYPRSLMDRDAQPDIKTRKRFLQQLAWWQWSTDEVMGPQFWAWLEGVLR